MRNSVRWIIIIILLLITVVLGIIVSTQQSDEDGSLITSTPTLIPVSTEPVTTVSQTTINLYFVALEDAGEQGEEIGCNDSIVAVERTLPQAENVVETTVELLLSENQQRIGDDQLYNALSQSNLFVEDIAVSATGSATVSLQGELVSGGVCDDPRIEAQIRQTVLQFPEVEQVQILINNRPLKELLSGQ